MKHHSWSKRILFLIAIAMFVALSPGYALADSAGPGDVNGDGKVTQADADAVADALAAVEGADLTNAQAVAADVNADDHVNLFDLILFARHLDPNLQEPFPADLITYTITYDKNDGSPVISETYKRGQTTKIPETPTRENYFFEGWYYGNSYFLPGGVLTSNLSLTARWRKIVNINDTSKIKITPPSEEFYLAEEVEPYITIIDQSQNPPRELFEGEDYTVSYKDNINVGTAKMTVTGINGYRGTKTFSFDIQPQPVNVGFNFDSVQTYTGSAISLQRDDFSFNCYVDESNIRAGRDYTVTYASKNGSSHTNVNDGVITVTVTLKGNYSGSGSTTFQIMPLPLEDETCTIGEIAPQQWTGKPIIPALVVKYGSVKLNEGTDYTVDPDSGYNNVDVSGGDNTASITVNGTGNYTGNLTANFQITEKPITNAVVTLPQGEIVYSGSEQQLDERSISVKLDNVTLVRESDYRVEYRNNVDAGKASLVIVGMGNYTGEKVETFTIQPLPVRMNFKIDSPKEYTGSDINLERSEIEFFASAIADADITENDYSVTYTSKNGSSHKDVSDGEITAAVTLKGNYTGTGSGVFEIAPVSIESSVISKIPDQSWTGEPITPKLTVKCSGKTLTLDKDYTISSCTDNVNVTAEGNYATVTISGMGNYTGTATANFQITGKSIKSADVAIDADNMVYNGEELELSPEQITVKLDNVTLKHNVDYTVSYKNNINVGKATVVVSGIGSYSGEKTAAFTIQPMPIEIATRMDSVQPYTGKAIVLDREDIFFSWNNDVITSNDYTVTYASANGSSHTNVVDGLITVTITMKGNYKGTGTAQFEILPMHISDCTVEDIADQKYTGQPIVPKTIRVKRENGSMLYENRDYTIESGSNNVNVSEGGKLASVIVRGMGNYNDSVTLYFQIVN